MINTPLRSLGLEVRKIKQEPPHRHYIDVFDLCAADFVRRERAPFVLQIGANDGVANDPVHDLIVEYSLPALLIEPHPIAFGRLVKTYQKFPHVKTGNFAISDSDGSVQFFVPSETLVRKNPRTDRLCSLSRDQLTKAFIEIGIENPSSEIVETVVESRTVPTLLKSEGISKIDILQIDAEGFDWKILKQFDLSATNVSLINIELFHLPLDQQHACLKHLTDSGYATSKFYGDLVAYKSLN